jgi:zinc transport system substrate-binding protein
VANEPLRYFATRLGAAAIEVGFLAPAGEDPAFWQPDDAAITALQQADLILMNGATYSKWADNISLPQQRVVDTSAAFATHLIHTTEATTHSHGTGPEHSHAGTAFTTWLDFQQATQQAEAVAEALKKRLPQATMDIDQNMQALRQDLQQLDARWQAISQKIAAAPIVASHPIYQYWARRYQVNLRAVLWEPETVPDAAALAGLQTLLHSHPAKVMIWEGPPAAESVTKITALGLRSLMLTPCANRPQQGDWLHTMQENAARFEAAFP